MPFWNFFAFDAASVAAAVLTPVQNSIRHQDLALWAKLLDQLRKTHPAPRTFYGRYSPNVSTLAGEVPGPHTLVADRLPQESDFELRRTLQSFVEHVASHRLQSAMTRPRHWVCDEISWPKVLKSQAEIDELEKFKNDIIARREKLPDPFWCLESNSAVDSNYISPESVKRMAEIESAVGAFRNLAKRNDLDPELAVLAGDLANAGLLIELAARQGLGLFFREDGT